MKTSKRIYLAFAVLVALWCAGLLLAPLLKSAGFAASSILYSFYSPICHQMDSHSFHVAGEKLAVCARCSSIYFGFLIALSVYPLIRGLAVAAIPGRTWLFLAVIPMVVDVLLNVTGVHPSTAATRILSGLFFGGFLPFYLVPPLLEAVGQVIDRVSTRGGLNHARKAE